MIWKFGENEIYYWSQWKITLERKTATDLKG